MYVHLLVYWEDENYEIVNTLSAMVTAGHHQDISKRKYQKNNRYKSRYLQMTIANKNPTQCLNELQTCLIDLINLNTSTTNNYANNNKANTKDVISASSNISGNGNNDHSSSAANNISKYDEINDERSGLPTQVCHSLPHHHCQILLRPLHHSHSSSGV